MTMGVKVAGDVVWSIWVMVPDEPTGCRVDLVDVGRLVQRGVKRAVGAERETGLDGAGRDRDRSVRACRPERVEAPVRGVGYDEMVRGVEREAEGPDPREER